MKKIRLMLSMPPSLRMWQGMLFMIIFTTTFIVSYALAR